MVEEEEKQISREEELEAIKARLDLLENLVDHMVLVLRQNKIQNKLDIPTREEILETVDEEATTE